jgi:hypothetical protein
MSRDHHPLLRDVTADRETHSLFYCCVLDRVYRDVAWRRVEQIGYNIYGRLSTGRKVTKLSRVVLRCKVENMQLYEGNPKHIGYESVGLIELAHDRAQWQPLLRGSNET